MGLAKKKYQGVSLIEVLLVLTIGIGILYLSVQQYLSYRRDVEFQEVRYNVDMIFQALGKYYRAHCQTDPDFNRLNGGGVVAVNLSTLVNEGFLTAKTLQRNPYVVNTGTGNGYILGFFQYQEAALAGLPKRIIVLNNGETAEIGNVTIWQAQVAVQLDLPTPAAGPAFKNALGAECLSNIASGWGGTTFVVPCQFATTGNYAVWTRAPSATTPQSNASYWVSIPLVKQFTQMYTTSPMLLLTNKGGGTNSQWATEQYFVCGN